ncbi:MAG: hypothetical protein JJU36_15000 [Phycisphaeraceae bacterium]|nr:hypothetical protein [Phycisphaeraceae bacterium]
MIIEKTARSTVTAVELDRDDELHFKLADGQVRRIRLLETRAGVYQSNLHELEKPGHKAKVVLKMFCRIEVDGHSVSVNRWVGNQDSFAPPWEFMGLRFWFDACQELFDHLHEHHGICKPRKHARLAVQDATLRLCPVLLHPWCPLHPDGLRIEDCYEGSDCWLGPYHGIDAHGGLDINHPAGTPIWTPVSIDEHGYFNSLANGDNNNRWRGIKRWDDGSTWVLQVHHILRLLVPEGGRLEAGAHIAEGAGVHVGTFEHSHFVFGVVEPGDGLDDRILLDPWLIFHQTFQDRAATVIHRH